MGASEGGPVPPILSAVIATAAVVLIGPVRLGVVPTIVAAATRTWRAITDTVHGVTQAVITGRGTENFSRHPRHDAACRSDGACR